MRPKTLKENNILTLRMETIQIEHIKNIAREQSYKQKKTITVSDIVRESVEKLYPIN